MIGSDRIWDKQMAKNFLSIRKNSRTNVVMLNDMPIKNMTTITRIAKNI
jgi:hypothetical protein